MLVDTGRCPAREAAGIRMQLTYISVPHLIAVAGGDPWAINNSLQVGRPAQISDLAEAFHAAGRCTTESSNAFDEARRRFEASWNRDNGDNPINDSAEVQRVAKSLGAQSLQLPKIGVELERIAAALAGVPRSGTVLISNLETQLEVIDSQAGVALAHENHDLLTALEDQAIGDTEATLGQLRSIRSQYSDCLQNSLNTLRTGGYDATVIQAMDAAGSGSDAGVQANRRQNQIDAFTKVFGRPPSSAADWETAAALDPHSYHPRTADGPPILLWGASNRYQGKGWCGQTCSFRAEPYGTRRLIGRRSMTISAITGVSRPRPVLRTRGCRFMSTTRTASSLPGKTRRSMRRLARSGSEHRASRLSNRATAQC